MGQPTLLCCGTVCGGMVRERTVLLAQLLEGFQSLPLLLTSKLSPTGADSQVGGFVYVLGPCLSLQRSLLWEFLLLRISPANSTPTGFFSQRFWGFISLCWNPGLCSLSCSPVVPPSLSTCKCGTTCSVIHLLAVSPLHPGCQFLPLLPVWMNVSSLTP